MMKSDAWPVLGLLVLLLLAVGRPAAAQPPADPFDPEADARAAIQGALAKARSENQRILLFWGSNESRSCQQLQALFKSDRTLSRTLLYEYVTVPVDVGQADRNLDLAAKYGAEVKQGVPCLTVLDATGQVLANQVPDVLAEGEHFDATKVRDFLIRWQAPPLDAEAVHQKALQEARESGRHLLVHLGAPW